MTKKILPPINQINLYKQNVRVVLKLRSPLYPVLQPNMICKYDLYMEAVHSLVIKTS